MGMSPSCTKMFYYAGISTQAGKDPCPDCVQCEISTQYNCSDKFPPK